MYPIITFFIGIISLTAQVLFLRELVVVFSGNELSVSAVMTQWLLFGGLGAFGGAFAAGRIGCPRRWAGAVFLLLSAVLPLTLILIRCGRSVLGVSLGETVGFSGMHLLSFMTLALPAALLTLLFTLVVEAQRSESGREDAPGRGYVWEALGAGAAGFALSFVLLRFFDDTRLLMAASGFSFLAGALLLMGRRRGMTAGLPALLLFLIFSPALQHQTLNFQWPGYELLETRNSIYGQIAVARREGQTSFFQNGYWMASVPALGKHETAVHPALISHPDPKNVLLIGDTSPDVVAEVVKHPVRGLACIEIDPVLAELKLKYAPDSTYEGMHVLRMRGDGRRLLERGRVFYDAVIVTLPGPATLLLNRFYTREFFEEARGALKSDGILSLVLPGMANYPVPELAKLIASVKGVLGEVFAETVELPLQSTVLLASDKKMPLMADSEVLSEALRLRMIKALKFNENYLPFELTDMRRKMLADALEEEKGASQNRDFAPAAQFYSTLYWSRFASPHAGIVFGRLARLPLVVWFAVPFVWLLAAAALKGSRRFRGFTVLNTMGWTGFSEIGFEMVIILAYQSLFGYAYLWIAAIFATFMAGLAIGGRVAIKTAGEGDHLLRKIRRVQIGIVLYPLVLLAVLSWIESGEVPDSILLEYGFPLLAVIAGFFGGWQFPLAQRYMACKKKHAASSTGRVYGVDLVGSCLGAALVGSVMVPILGAAGVCLWLFLMNAAALILLFAAGR